MHEGEKIMLDDWGSTINKKWMKQKIKEIETNHSIYRQEYLKKVAHLQFQINQLQHPPKFKPNQLVIYQNKKYKVIKSTDEMIYNDYINRKYLIVRCDKDSIEQLEVNENLLKEKK